MESAFAWIGRLIEWFGAFIPRWKIIRSTHAGVRFKKGVPSAIEPGRIIWYWPVTTEVEIIPVARQTHNLPTQSLTTRDGKKIVIGGVVVYSIKDIVKAIADNWDVSATINDITMCAITQVITKHDFQYLQDNLSDAVQQALTEETRKKLAVYGVRVYRTAITDFSIAVIIRNIGNGEVSLNPIMTV